MSHDPAGPTFDYNRNPRLMPLEQAGTSTVSATARPRAAVLRYAAAFVAVGVAALVVGLYFRVGVTLGITPPFMAAVAISALLGGVGPAVVAILLGNAVLNYWFIPPFDAFGWASTADVLRQALFFTCGVIVAIPSVSLRTAHAAAIRNAQETARLRELAEESAVQAEEAAAAAEEESVRAEDEAARATSAAHEAWTAHEATRAANEQLAAANEELQAALDEVEERRTAAEAAARALADSEERLRLAMDAGRFGAWDWDVPANRVTWSPRLYEFFGLEPGQFGGTVEAFSAFVHPEDADRVNDALNGAVEDGSEFSVEFRVRRPSGDVRWLAATARCVHDRDGMPVRVLGTTLDVTERKAAEQHLRQMQRLESVGRLAGGVAHEVNNQMTVVLGFADFLARSGGLPDPLLDDVLEIRRAGERSAAITSQLLAFSRQQVLRPLSTNLNRVIAEFDRVLEKTLGERSSLILRLAPDLPEVLVDRVQIEQVLLNLVLNAADAMPDGGRLTIETSVADLSAAYARRKPGVSLAPGRYAMVAVSDTGNGMPPEVAAHAFEPFYTTKPVGQGSGLGLASVYGIMKQSNGYVWLYSEPGRGTTLKLYFPALTADDAATALADAAPAPDGSETVLVVDDEASVRHLIVRTLRERGYEVLEAGTGLEALEVLGSSGPVSLVLTDVAMPRLDGRELGERIAARWPSVPVLYTSGFTDSDVVTRGLIEQGAPFLQKPFSPEVLARRVRSLLDGART